MPKNVISFMNMKGGVGKTTVCVNIAGQLSNIGQKILIVDMDPQMNATQYLLKPAIIEHKIDNNKTIYSLYKKDMEQNLLSMSGEIDNGENDISIIHEKVRDNLDIICGDLNMTKVNDTDGTITDILSAFIETNELRDKYDFIFIDCPPTQSIYTISAFKASDFYLLIIKPDYLSTVGLSLFQVMVTSYNSRRTQLKKLKPLGIIANLTQKGNGNYYDNKLIEIREKFKFNTIFDNKIINNSKIAEASEKQQLMYETRGCITSIKNLSKEFLEVFSKEVKK